MVNCEDIALIYARANVEEADAGLELRGQGIAAIPANFCAIVSVSWKRSR